MDKKFNLLYLYNQRMNTIRVHDYLGKFRITAETKHTLRGVHLDSQAQVVYYTRQPVRTTLTVGESLPHKGRTFPVKIQRTLSWKPITGFGVTRHWIVIVSKRAFQIYHRSTLKKKARGGGDLGLMESKLRMFSFDNIY